MAQLRSESVENFLIAGSKICVHIGYNQKVNTRKIWRYKANSSTRRGLEGGQGVVGKETSTYRGSSACTNSTSTNSTCRMLQKDPYLSGLHKNISLARSNTVLCIAQISFSTTICLAQISFSTTIVPCT